MAKQTTTVASVRSRRTAAAARKTGGLPRIEWSIPLGRTNFLILAAGIVVIIIGYVLMGTAVTNDPMNNEGVWNNAASVTIAPILLGLGYCLIIPVAILWRPRKLDAPTEEVTE